jgi:hypothetical protein
MTRNASLIERFESKVEPVTESGCWLWRGCVDGSGYPIFYVGGFATGGHRFSYASYVGPIGDRCVCHRCDVPACVNPSHLFLGTHAENMQDRARKGRARSAAARGEAHPFARLSAEKVLAIRASSAPNAHLASLYGVTPGAIWNVRAGLAWGHVQTEGK